MKKLSLAAAVFCIVAGFASPAHADLESFLKRVDAQARADIKNFNVQLSAQFGIPVPRIDAIVRSVPAPADAFMVLQLGQMANRQPEAVMQTYQRNRGRGWGEIAKELGIKPGSPEFHALKRGDLAFTGEPGGGGHGHGKDKGKGKGRGHSK